MTCRQAKWTLKDGGLVAVCSYCVAEGLVAAPPERMRTDGVCPEHMEAVRKEIEAWKRTRDTLAR